MRQMKRAELAITAILVVVSLISSASVDASEKAGPIKIGGIVSYTGWAAGTGDLFENGIRMRLEEAGWKAGGRQIELIMEDGASIADTCLDKAKKLVTVDKVQAIIGPMNSPGGHAIAGYLVRHRIPIVGFWHLQKDSEKYGTAVIPTGRWEWEGLGLGRYAAEKLGHKTGSAVMPDIFTGRSYTDSVMIAFEKAGGKVLSKVFYPYGSMDFEPMILKAAADKPDFILTFHMDPPTALRYVQQYRQFGVKPQILMIGAESLDPVFPELGDLTRGMVGETGYAWTLDTEINRRFVRAFEERSGGMKPDAFATAAYRSTSLLLAAIEAARGDTSPGKLIKAFKGLSVDTPMGPIKVDSLLLGHATSFVVEADQFDGDWAWRVVESYVMGE